jgi:hypothetical protein
MAENNLVEANIRAGVSIWGKAGSQYVQNTNLPDAGATYEDIGQGKQAWVNGRLVTGVFAGTVNYREFTTSYENNGDTPIFRSNITVTTPGGGNLNVLNGYSISLAGSLPSGYAYRNRAVVTEIWMKLGRAGARVVTYNSQGNPLDSNKGPESFNITVSRGLTSRDWVFEVTHGDIPGGVYFLVAPNSTTVYVDAIWHNPALS